MIFQSYDHKCTASFLMKHSVYIVCQFLCKKRSMEDYGSL